MSNVGLHALTVDVEEWYDPQLIRRRRPDLDGQECAAAQTREIARLLARHDVRATFFFVGRVAEREPQLVRDLAEAGHEIGFHGMQHEPLWELDTKRFAQDVEAFNAVLRRVLGPNARAYGYRAPTFSLDGGNDWALGVLARAGYEYDASVVPVRGPLYGINGAPLELYYPALDAPGRVDDGQRTLVEFPAAVWEPTCALGGRAPRTPRMPIGGGFYLRLMPLGLLRAALRQVARQRPFALYLHPWETTAQVPRVDLPPLSRFVTYHGLAHTLAKLERLLVEFRFGTMREVIATWKQQQA